MTISFLSMISNNNSYYLYFCICIIVYCNAMLHSGMKVLSHYNLHLNFQEMGSRWLTLVFAVWKRGFLKVYGHITMSVQSRPWWLLDMISCRSSASVLRWECKPFIAGLIKDRARTEGCPSTRKGVCPSARNGGCPST